jgi:hypothetical protein
VGVFSQRLRKFPQVFQIQKGTFLRKLSLFDPAYVLLFHGEGEPKARVEGAAAWLLKNRQAQEGLEKHNHG